MLTLNSWVLNKRKFSVILADLEGLKYINDDYGHTDGDAYIINTAKHLKSFSLFIHNDVTTFFDTSKGYIPPEVVVSRIGGDEFMLLASDLNYDEAFAVMNNVCNNLVNDKYVSNKDYSYNINFGISAVDADNELSTSEILSIADQRLNDSKQFNKKERFK